jgi:hypothetical protein
MPPRYAYWTILVDEQPTAFRAGSLEDLLPTFNRLKEKSPSARMVWFQNGKVWNSRVEAQEAMFARGERGRAGDARQGSFRDRPARPQNPAFAKATAGKPRPRTQDPRPKTQDPRPRTQDPRPAKLEWRPKDENRPSRPQDLKTSRPQGPRPSKPQGFKAPRPRTQDPRPAKLEWRPKGENRPSRPHGPKPQDPGPRTQDPGKRKWVPKADYKKAQGIEAKRDKNWRPGGEHKDPRQKYKDAKKAKWTRFKQTVRKQWEGKAGKKKGDR